VLKIRMRRAGAKNRPFFRVVVMDSRRARDSRSVEELGYYNPLEDPLVINVNRERVTYWVGQGAQLSDSVRTLLKNENSEHRSRRVQESFEAMLPEERPAPKAGGKKTRAKASAQPAVALQERGEEEDEVAAATPGAEPAETTPDAEPAETGETTDEDA
jgi:small subunit ribosomal protein S16